MTTYPSGSDSSFEQRESGFTLLEILVAMTILTLIVTAAFGALRLGERSWEAGLRHTTETENLRTVSSALHRLFNQSLPIKWKLNGKNTIAFSGNSLKLSFIGPAPQHHGATGLFEYSLALEKGKDSDDDNRLMLYYRLHDPDRKGFADESKDRQEIVLVEKLVAATFSFYGSAVPGDPPQWLTFWSNSANTFPLMVRVQLDPRAEQNPWPDMFLALHTAEKK